MASLKDKTIFITGSSRGIGRTIAVRCARDGANVVITGKTAEPHPKLKGTIHTVADEVTHAGGTPMPLKLDVRDADAVEEAMQKTVDRFGGIDILINNASAINLSPTLEVSPKNFDLMMSVNARATFFCSRAAIPHLKNADNPHILNLSPPLNMEARWFKGHLAYTYSKYGMSMCTLGMAEEFRQDGIAVNSLWPQTTIATAAIAVHFPQEILQASRKPDIMADAAYEVLIRDAREATGNFYIDEDVLREAGMKDFSGYSLNPGVEPFKDLFLE